MNTSIINKLIKKKKAIYISMGIICLLLLILGGTYAYIVLAVNTSNGRYNTNTTCFDITYDVTNDDGTLPITGTMFPSSTPKGGLSGKVSMKINDDCNVSGTGTLTLKITNANSTLLQTVSAHCENSKTLKTMTEYTTNSTCAAQTNGKWVTTGTALKYAVYNTDNVTSSTVPLNVGYVTNSSSVKLYDGFDLTKTAVTYYVYIWLDGNISDNSYANLSFNGNISASAIQREE